MLRTMASNPADMFRQLLSEWEKLANSVGGDLMKSEEWSRAMNAGTSVHLQAQGATREMMAKALAAANLPSRAEFEDLSGRLARIEEALIRIEAAIAPGNSVGGRPKPTRGRKAAAA